MMADKYDETRNLIAHSIGDLHSNNSRIRYHDSWFTKVLVPATSDEQVINTFKEFRFSNKKTIQEVINAYKEK